MTQRAGSVNRAHGLVVNGALIAHAGDNHARHVATIASLGINWSPAPDCSSIAVVAYARPGAFLRESGADDALSLISLNLQYRV
ncbi:MAG: hypothetical protein ACN6O2_00550 [Stenotrophomonas sp.]